MIRGVVFLGEVKDLGSGAEAKASLNWANEFRGADPKPSDLPMARMKRG